MKNENKIDFYVIDNNIIIILNMTEIETTKIWVVQMDEKEKDDHSSTRRLFHKREDAFAYVKKVMERAEKYMMNNLNRDIEVEERCSGCTDNTKCHNCEWCRDRDHEKGQKCCMNETQFEASPRSYFYFETNSGYDDYYDGPYYTCGVILEQLAIQ
jgi:hypothetical protein